jgi:amino acid transporter
MEAGSLLKKPFATKSPERLIAETEDRNEQLKKGVGSLVPLIGMALCVFLMTYLEGLTWLRFGVWMVAGLVIYVAYGRTHSRLQRGEEPDTAETA